MKGCTLAGQHKRSMTDLLKVSVWHLLSAGETEPEHIMLDNAQQEGKKKKKLCFKNQSHPHCYLGRLLF